MNDMNASNKLQTFCHCMYLGSGSKGVIFGMEYNRKSWKYHFIAVSYKVCDANVHRLACYLYLGLVDLGCDLYDNWGNL